MHMRGRSSSVAILSAALALVAAFEIPRIAQGSPESLVALILCPVLWAMVLGLVFLPVNGSLCRLCRTTALRIGIAVAALAVFAGLVVSTVMHVTPGRFTMLAVDSAVIALGAAYGVSTLRRQRRAGLWAG